MIQPALSSTLARRALLTGASLAATLAGQTGSPRADRGRSDARAKDAFDLRRQFAEVELRLGEPLHPTNGDEPTYHQRIGSFSKGLPPQCKPNGYRLP